MAVTGRGFPERHKSPTLPGAMTTDTDPVSAYKNLPLEDRLALALSASLTDTERHCILMREQWMQVRCYFARRADLTPQEIAVLLSDQDHVIRLCIAKRPDLAPEQVWQCVRDRDPNVRYFIARNSLLETKQRALLLADEDPLVRRAAAKGPRPVRIESRPGQAALVR